MKKQKLLILPALLLAVILALCGCEIDLTNLVTDVVLITSKEASSGEASSDGSSEVSSEEAASSSELPEESRPADTATSEPEPEPEPEPIPEPVDPDPSSEAYIPPSSKPSSSKPVSSEPVSSEPASSDATTKPSNGTLTKPHGPWPHPWLDRTVYRFPFDVMRTIRWTDPQSIRQIGVTYSTVYLDDLYGGVYTDPQIISALVELLIELETGEREKVTDDGDMGVETCPISFYIDDDTSLTYCPTFYLRFAEEKVYVYEYWQKQCHRYEITNLDEIRPKAREIYTAITGKTLETE